MASLRERTAPDGTTTFQVLFRDGGRQRSKTMVDRKSAENLVGLMSALGVKRALSELANAGSLTLDDLLDPFLEWKAGRVVSDRTVKDYRRDYDNWIKPALGWRSVDSIDEQDVQGWVDDMRDGTAEGNKGKTLGPKSIGDRHAILHGIFKWASSPTRKHALHNPCVGTELPPKTKTAPKGLRPAEWQALHAALVTINPDAAELAVFLLASGWRWSEAVALSTFDVEDYGDRMWVNMTRVARRHGDGVIRIVDGAKSDAGLRRIQLDAEAAAMVRHRMAKMVDGNQGLVFTGQNGYEWNQSHYRERYWDKAVEAAGLDRKPTPHWLRHTSVAFLILSRQVSPVEISRRIGHSSIKTTMDVYGRMIEDISDDGLDAFAAMRNIKPQTVKGQEDPRQIGA